MLLVNNGMASRRIGHGKQNISLGERGIGGHLKGEKDRPGEGPIREPRGKRRDAGAERGDQRTLHALWQWKKWPRETRGGGRIPEQEKKGTREGQELNPCEGRQSGRVWASDLRGSGRQGRSRGREAGGPGSSQYCLTPHATGRGVLGGKLCTGRGGCCCCPGSHSPRMSLETSRREVRGRMPISKRF